MFFDDIGNDREAVTPRAEFGRKGVVYPALADTTQERNHTLPACSNCSKLADHGKPCCEMGRVVDVGDEVLDVVNPEEVAEAEFLHRLVMAIWATHYVLFGRPMWRPENFGMGTSNNVTQGPVFEILSVVAPNRLRIKCDNPLNMLTGYTVTNPEWPFEAPAELRPEWMSDEEWDIAKFAYLIPQGKRHCLPICAMVDFAFPSVLAKKLNPYVTKIIPGTSAAANGVEYEIELSHTVSYAMTPYDLAYPPSDGKYYGGFYYYSLVPEEFPNFQVLETMWITRKQLTVDGEAFATASGVIELNNSNGDGCRVLAPSMGTGVLVVRYKREGAAPVTLSDAEVTAALTIDDDGEGWQASLDLSALLEFEDIEGVTVIYMPEAVEGDSPVIPMQGSCSNSQRDYTGSYIHTEALTSTGYGSATHRCMNVFCSKFQAGKYRTSCYDPKASGFVRGYGTGGFPITNPRDSKWLMRLWSDVTLIRVQGLPGLNNGRNFWIERKGVPSLQEIVGGVYDMVPQGKFSRREPLNFPRMGQRREFVNGDDEADHEVIHGLFGARTYRGNQSEGYEDLGFVGALREIVSGWDSRKDARNDTLTTREKDFPSNSPPPAHLYQYDLGVNGASYGLRVSDASCEMFITGVPRAAVNSAAMTVIGELL